MPPQIQGPGGADGGRRSYAEHALTPGGDAQVVTLKPYRTSAGRSKLCVGGTGLNS